MVTLAPTDTMPATAESTEIFDASPSNSSTDVPLALAPVLPNNSIERQYVCGWSGNAAGPVGKGPAGSAEGHPGAVLGDAKDVDAVLEGIPVDV